MRQNCSAIAAGTNPPSWVISRTYPLSVFWAFVTNFSVDIKSPASV